MTEPELFESGEGVISSEKHLPFNPLGVAIILELSALPGRKVGEDTLRAAMRLFLGSKFQNEEGLTGEIGRVMGKGKPIAPRILAEAEKRRPFVRRQLAATLGRWIAQLSREGESTDE